MASDDVPTCASCFHHKHGNCHDFRLELSTCFSNGHDGCVGTLPPGYMTDTILSVCNLLLFIGLNYTHPGHGAGGCCYLDVLEICMDIFFLCFVSYVVLDILCVTVFIWSKT